MPMMVSVSNNNNIFWSRCVLTPLINLDRNHPMIAVVTLTKTMMTEAAAIWNAWEMYLIWAYYRPMSNDQIRCRNRAIHRFGCNDVFGIWAVVAMTDVVDGDEMAAVEWQIQLNRAQTQCPAPATMMTMHIHSNPNTRNPWIVPIVVYDLDFRPSIDVRMHAIAVKNGNLVICLAYVNAPMRMPPQS